MKFTIPWRFYEILATPAHLWLWLCAKMCGGSFECGPVEEDEDGNLCISD